jgi:hypothetical protein
MIFQIQALTINQKFSRKNNINNIINNKNRLKKLNM